MEKKPSYEALQQRIEVLEAQCRDFDRVRGELEQRRSFTASLLAAIPTPVFWKDVEGRYLGCNTAFTEIMGVTSEQICGKTVQDLWPGAQAAVYHRKDLALMENPRRQVYAFEVTDKDGGIRPVIYYKNVFRDERGIVAGLVGGFADISDVRKAQQELQTLFSMSLDMICIADINTATFLKVNPAFTATLGYSEEELLSTPYTEFIHPDDVLPTRKVLEESLKKGRKVINFKNRYRCKDGTYRFLNWVSHPVPEAGVTYGVAHDVTEEIQAMDAREASYRLLQSVLDAVPDLLIVIDRDFRIRYSNYRGHDLIAPPEETPEHTCYGRFKLLDAPCEDCSAAPVFANGERVQREMVNPADGRVREVRAFPIFDAEGRVSSVIEYVRDITEIRQAQEEVDQRRQFLESVLYHAPDAIVTLDKSHRVVDWNPGAVKMFGYSPEEAVGVQLDDLVARGAHHIEAGSKTSQVLSGSRVEAFETVRYRKDGAPVNVIAAGSPIMVEGELKGVVAVYTDITDRVRGEEALKISHQRFITVLDSIDATIYVADIKTHEILFMNRRMIEDFGKNLIGKICYDVFRREAGPCPNCSNDRLVDESGRPTGVIVWQGHNPVSDKWYINYDRAIEWIDGRVVRLQIATDISEYKKMETALQRAQRMEAVGTLASGIAHDFNNLLMGIQGHVSLIASDLVPNHPHVARTAAIEEYIRSAVGLTKQLLGLVRGGKYEVRPLDASALLESTAALFGRTHKEIRIRTKTAPEPLVVEADKRQLEQVLLNIYVNAWQAMPEGGDLFLETLPVALDDDVALAYQVPPGQFVKISLTDTGIGMTEAVQQKIFDPFFTTKDKSRGTGLGLASAYGIVRNHGGTITVYSEVGHGTTFNVYLPRSGRQLAAEAPAVGVPLGGTETVLLVDDEAMILEVGEAMLERLGYRVVVADSGTAAVERVKEVGEGIDLVILDLIMPEIDGGKTFDRIREVRPPVPVILSSGYSINGQAAKIMDRGCNGFIQKPFNLTELARKIREVLDAGKIDH